MSRYSWSGRHTSPYAVSPNRSPPVIHDEDYTYMTQDDQLDPPAEPWNGRQGQGTYSGATHPDIIFVKYRNHVEKLDFAPFSICEGYVKIGLIRKYAADLLDVSDVRRLKLRYKGRTLRDDAMPARDAGLKQNSELTCIVTEAPYDDSGSSGDETAIPSRRPLPTEYEDPTSRSRPNRTGRGNRRDRADPIYPPPNPTPTASNPTTPSRTAFPTPTPTTSASPNLNNPNNNTTTTTTNPPPQSYTPPPGPRTPKETVQDLITIFNTQYRPQCQEFIDRPPTDPKTRAAQHTKLSETVLAQIILKLDNVQTDGNEALRRMRKAAVLETQSVLGMMDKVVGKGK